MVARKNTEIELSVVFVRVTHHPLGCKKLLFVFTFLKFCLVWMY